MVINAAPDCDDHIPWLEVLRWSISSSEAGLKKRDPLVWLFGNKMRWCSQVAVLPEAAFR